MAAINGVKKSSVVKKSKSKFGALSIVLSVIITLLIAALAVIVFWKYYYQEQVTNQVIMQMQSGQQQVYKASRDISSGEYIDGAIELVVVPSSVIASDLVVSGDNIAGLKASGDIKANSLITDRNSYNPEMESAVIAGTREYVIDYIKTPGVVVGDYIDIRLKTFNEGDESTYQDYIVASKVEILNKGEAGEITVRLNQSDILNLNSAVIEAAGISTDITYSGEIYVGKYVEPATQPKATVNYNGAGAQYTQAELQQAQNILRDEMNGIKNDTTGEDEQTQDTTIENTDDMTNTDGESVTDPVTSDDNVENTEGGQN